MVTSISELRLPSPGGRVIPVVELASGREGPLVVVTANLHGDEATGVGAVHALAARLGAELLRGRLRLFPSLNPAGLAQGVRGLPGEEHDPNRCFPGDPVGRPASRHASALWGGVVAGRPDLVIDLHTDGADAVPYALVDRVVRGPLALEERCLGLAEASGLLVVREYPEEDYLRFGLDQSLAGALVNSAAIAAVTLEIGPRRWISPDAVAEAGRATCAILAALGMLQAEPAPRTGERWTRIQGPRPAVSGVFVPLVRSGARVERGAPLAEIRSLSGGLLERLVALADGLVLSFAERAWATPGTSLLTFAVRER